jgi:isoleucyl-tRNA synthetase
MPFAQFHYPFENKEKFETSFPADFIVEAIDQTRGWFYSLTAVNVALFGKSPFKNLICTGFINAADGKKMSKKLKNYTDPMELMDQYSVDAFRFLMLSSPLLNGEDFSLKDKDVADVARKLGMVWNMYDFFTLYAEVDNWEWGGSFSDPTPELKNPLDLWIVSRIHQLTEEVQKHMDAYDLPNATKPILPFIDDASNWYIRRSRRRFWKSGDDADKQAAYRTLHYVLVRLAHVLAPFTPFMAEELYRKLTDGESVHLQDWPGVGHTDEQLLGAMVNVRQAINDGLSRRAKAGIKVRQPLASATLVSTIGGKMSEEVNRELVEIAKEELNVKAVRVATGSEVDGPPSPTADLDLEVTPGLRREGLMREVVRNVQAARKDAGLDVDDRILLSLSTSDEELRKAISEHEQTVTAETLAENVTSDQTYTYETECTVEKSSLLVSLQKA